MKVAKTLSMNLMERKLQNNTRRPLGFKRPPTAHKQTLDGSSVLSSRFQRLSKHSKVKI